MIDLVSLAREYEKKGMWREAQKIWEYAGRFDDAHPCRVIADAREKGDKFRTLVDQKMSTPQPHLANLPPCQMFDQILREASVEVYGV